MGGLFGGAQKPLTQTTPAVSDLSIQTSTFGKVVTLLWGKNRVTGNLIWYSNFQSHAHKTGGGSSGGKGGGGGSSSGSTSYTYSTSFAMGLCEGEIQGIGSVYASKQIGTPASYGMAVMTGATPQAPWSYLSSAFPSQALGYSGLAIAAAANFDLGSNTSLPNFSFEVIGKFSGGFSGSPDALPALIVPDFLANPLCGAGFPLSKICDLTQYDSFTKAMGLLVSPVLDTAKPAQQFIEDLCQATCSAPVWASTKLKIIPYADQVVTGNGVTFMPSTVPVYDLTDDDFIDDGSTDPITVKRGDSADAYNSVSVEYVNRNNQYNTDTITAQDQANIDLYGLRPNNPIQLHMITSADVAQKVAQFHLQRSCYVRNVYSFTLGWRHCLLEPMDVVTINDAALGLSKYPVLIKEIEEDNDTGYLKMTAEDFPDHVSTPSAYAAASGSGYAANFNVSPGAINTPVIFDAPGILTASGFEIWAAISGGPNYGGASVWVSEDGNTYAKVGTIHGEARHGVLSAALPVGSDPDTSHTAAVDLSVSGGQLLSGTQSDADVYNTICLVGSELVSYETATLTAANQYNLAYLRRGVYGSKIVAHAAGDAFVRLDQAVFKYAYNPRLIDSTIYLKFTAFNQVEGGEQSLAEVPAYPYFVGGSISRPPNVTGFTASQNGNVVVMQWDRLTDTNIAGYDIRYSKKGDTTWSHGTPITQAMAGTQITTATLSPGSWTLLICARDSSGVYSPTAAHCDLTMINVNALLYSAPQAPDWLSQFSAGQMDGFVCHWTGALVPQSQGVTADDGWNTFDQYVPRPYPAGHYQTPEIDLGSSGAVRVHGEIASILGPGAPGIAAPALEIDTRVDGGDYQGFAPWTIGVKNCRYIKMRIALDTSIGLPVIQGFAPTVDGESLKQSGQTVVPVGGVTITFAQKYHAKPIPQATAVGSSGLLAVITAETTQSMTVNVFNTNDIDVGGTVNWSVDGV